MAAQDNLNKKQFYHGTSAALKPGDYLSPKGANEFGRHETESGRSHVYATLDEDTAWGYAIDHAGSVDRAHVYQVQPTGKTEPDPNAGEYPAIRTRARMKVTRELAY